MRKALPEKSGVGVPWRVVARVWSVSGYVTGEVTRFAVDADEARRKALLHPRVAETISATPMPLHEFRARCYAGRSAEKGGGS